MTGQGGGLRPDEPDDRALLTAHLAGDAAAFGTLVTRHRDRLWAVALRTAGDREEAADALQEALVAAFRRADSFRGDAAVGTWLHRIVVNACLDRLRRREVRRRHDGGPLPDDLDSPAGNRVQVHAGPPGTAFAATPDDPADVAVAHDRRARVLAALDTLPPDQRAALVLVDMEGYSVEETARILDCAPGTVKSRCFRGRARLLPLLRGLDAPPAAAHGAVRGNPDVSGRVPSDASPVPAPGPGQEVSGDDD